jgi:hypothetical protein
LDGGLTELQHRDCVTLYYNPVLYCLNASGHLPCEIEIGREQLDAFVSGQLQEFLPVDFAIGNETEIRRGELGQPPPPRLQYRPSVFH